MYLEQLHVYMPFVFTINIHELQDSVNFYSCICGLVSEQCLMIIILDFALDIKCRN